MSSFLSFAAAVLLSTSFLGLVACETATGDENAEDGDVDGCGTADPDACHGGCVDTACTEDELEVDFCSGEEGSCREDESEVACNGCIPVVPCEPTNAAADLEGAPCRSGEARCSLGEGEEAAAFECFFDRRWRCVEGEACAYSCELSGVRLADTACPAEEQGVLCTQTDGYPESTDLVCCGSRWTLGSTCPEAG